MPTTARWYNPDPRVARTVMKWLGHDDALVADGVFTEITAPDEDHLRGQLVALWKWVLALRAERRWQVSVMMNRHRDVRPTPPPQHESIPPPESPPRLVDLRVVGAVSPEYPSAWLRYAQQRTAYVRAVVELEEAERLAEIIPRLVPGFSEAARRLLGVGHAR